MCVCVCSDEPVAEQTFQTQLMVPMQHLNTDSSPDASPLAPLPRSASTANLQSASKLILSSRLVYSQRLELPAGVEVTRATPSAGEPARAVESSVRCRQEQPHLSGVTCLFTVPCVSLFKCLSLSLCLSVSLSLCLSVSLSLCLSLSLSLSPGHLSSSSIYPVCLAPYLIVTTCSDSHVRFWRCAVEGEEGQEEGQAEGRAYRWEPWALLNEEEDNNSSVRVSGRPVAVSCFYTGRLAVSFKQPRPGQVG